MASSSIFIKSICEQSPTKRGAVCLSGDEIIYKGWFRKCIFRIADIVLIEGYEEVSMGLEEYICVDVVFKDGRKLLFSGTEEQQVFINRLHQKLKVATIDWSQPFVFTSQRMVLYQL